MTVKPFSPTTEQAAIVEHEGPAFVRACPGAGKTRTMVARAQRLFSDPVDKRGVAFLSFTKAAISELHTRLSAYGVLPHPLFPSYLGTFDSFLWQFVITPLGVPGCAVRPRLIPDKGGWGVKPKYELKPGQKEPQALTLECFDRQTGSVIPSAAADEGFDTTKRNIKPYETIAKKIIAKSLEDGLVDFDDVRGCVEQHLSNPAIEARIGIALSARFREVIVDEAQDCNPADLNIIKRMQKAGIPVKVICDPDQSIYGFRGGVTGEFKDFSDSFDEKNSLTMTGNFRSTPAICNAISALRPSAPLGVADAALGENKDDMTPVHIITYKGKGVPATIGETFNTLVEVASLPLSDAVVLASTWKSGAKAIGQAYIEPKNNMTLCLATAAMNYHFAFALGGLKEALIGLHMTVLWVQGHINTRADYHRYIQDQGLDDGRWRPKVITLAKLLQFRSEETPEAWLDRARIALSDEYIAANGINNRLKNTADLAKSLSATPKTSCPSRTIHSAKGLEFPAVCVVMTTTSGKILDLLEGADLPKVREDARKIYVAASRAQRLLAIAVPASQATRLQSLLEKARTPLKVHNL